MAFYAYLSKNQQLAKGYLDMALTQSPIYYERAWKNLAAISDENNPERSSSEPAIENLGDAPEAPAPSKPKHKSHKVSASESSPSPAPQVEMIPPVVSTPSPSSGTSS